MRANASRQCVTDNPARARSTIYEIVKDNGWVPNYAVPCHFSLFWKVVWAHLPNISNHIFSARFTPTAFLFNKRAVVRITLPKEQFDQELEKLWDVAIELGVDDILPVEEEESAMENVEATDEVNRKEVEVRFSFSRLGPHFSVQYVLLLWCLRVLRHLLICPLASIIQILASPDLLSTISIKLSQPPYSYTLTESELQWRPADAEVAKSEGEAQSEEGREKLQKLVEELEESPECVGVWVSIA